MIIFLNFAPIEFMGGAERWMNELKNAVLQKEEAKLFSLKPSIANIYGRIVLKRKYDNRSKDSITNYERIGWLSFIPFTNSWRRIRNNFNSARMIYFRYEVIESLLLIYFGGIKTLKKSIAGVHTPLLYHKPKNSFDRLHKNIYESGFSNFILRRCLKVHVLNDMDLYFLQTKYRLTNVIVIPNGVDIPKLSFDNKVDAKVLRIIFVGELILRKGVDILIEVIKNSPRNFTFDIVGNGPMSDDVRELEAELSNVKYHGYINKDQLKELYLQNDVLLLPSRAESMSLVMLEAISFGLFVLVSNDISVTLPVFIQKKSEYNW